MNVVANGYSSGGSINSITLGVIHGVVLALLLIGLLSLPSWLPFARVVKVVIAVFVLFLVIDDLVNGSLGADAGLLGAAGLTLACAALYGRVRRRGHETG